MPFNAAQWSRDHEKADDMRFKAIFGILAFIGVTFVSLTGWSLKAQYDQMQKQDTALRAIYTVSGQVANVQATAVPKPLN